MSSSALQTMAVRAPSPRKFVSPEATHLRDEWDTSVFSDLCFDHVSGSRYRWLLLIQRRATMPKSSSFASAAFQRYPLHVRVVDNRSQELAARKAQCHRPGATFVADLRHSGATMGIAHFAKRILRLHGLQRQAASYALPAVERIAFPATTAAHLAHSWPASMQRLVAPAAAAESAEALQHATCCY